jgi:hypothetical protein
MWCIGEFARQILAGEMQILVQIQPPLGAISHIVYDAFIGNVFPGAALTHVAAEFRLCNDRIWDLHW